MKMKGFIILFVALTFVKTEETIYRSQIDPAYSEVSNNNLRTVASSVRIVGGDEAVPNSFPYQAALFIGAPRGTLLCGGAVISTNKILTAGHCLNRNVSSIEVILGAHRIHETESTQQRFVTTNFTIHEEFNNTLIRNDIAVVTLMDNITFNDYVQPIDLPTRAQSSNSFAGYEAISSGWGLSSESETTISDVLRYVNLTVITNQQCSTYYPRYIRRSNICTSGSDGKGNCNGDSGGPLVTGGVLIGLISFSSGDGCEAGEPSAFTRVTSYLDWIEEHSNVVIV